MDLLIKKEAEIKYLKCSQLIHIEKIKNTNGVAKQTFDRLVCISHPSGSQMLLFKTMEE